MNQARIATCIKFIPLAGLVAIILAYFTLPGFKTETHTVTGILMSGNIEGVINYIRSFGAWAAGVSFILMIFQAIAAPIPAFLITFANAAIFGWVYGAILSWTSAMAGAALCFYIARILGRDATEKLITKMAVENVDQYFKHYGNHTILICRLLPFVSFDFVSYAAGLTAMNFLGFFIATGIGQLPATLIYSYVGGMLTGGAQLFVTGLLILFALSIFALLMKNLFKKRKAPAAAAASGASKEIL